MKGEIYFCKAPGVAIVIMHKKKASTVLNLVTNQDEDKSLETEKIAMKIKSKIKVHLGSGISVKWKFVEGTNLTYLKWYTGHNFSQI